MTYMHTGNTIPVMKSVYGKRLMWVINMEMQLNGTASLSFFLLRFGNVSSYFLWIST